jgi:hypothetical protein
MISEEVACTVVIFCRVAALAIEAGAAAAVEAVEAVAAVTTADAKELRGTTRYLKPLTIGLSLVHVFTLYMQRDVVSCFGQSHVIDYFFTARYSILKHPTRCIP